MKLRTVSIIILVSALLLFLDQWTKHIALSFPYLPIFEPYLSFKTTLNEGIAFSIPFPKTLLLICNILIFIIFFWFLASHLNLKKSLSQISFIFFIAGALGNIIDRALYGKVIDFIHVSYFSVFNLADIYLTLCALLLLIFYPKMQIAKKSKI